MNRDFRNQVIIATISSPREFDGAGDIMRFVDKIEKYDDVHELEYERTIVDSTRGLIRDAIQAGEIRQVLPAVMTFKALAQTGATSSLIVHLQAQFMDILKRTNGPASLTREDADKLLDFFDTFVGKYDAEIAERKAALEFR